METNRLIKISSITKKLLIALFGAFLLVFLLFHMCANLFILANDGGDAYSAFCHFMGTNIIVKIFEIVLFGCLILHAVLTVWLWWLNKKNRPVGYHKHSRTKTAKGSKLAIITGSLLVICLAFHFYDFYFVKLNFVKGSYMVKMEDFMTSDPTLEISEEAQLVFINAINDGRTSKDMKWLRNLSAEDKDILQQAFPEAGFEPDFYAIAHQKFSVWHIVLCYLVFFFVVGLHIRHGFESAFQTFGLNHYKYSRIVEILGIVYCWVVCLGFAIVPIGVFFRL
ncbi:MAG: succinate dehydrogenase cytochrome b subunit [Bacteroidales bacterium]|nr:succinate dehydrogenase cytochrome b subunit [Bacteroidales bacterium]